MWMMFEVTYMKLHQVLKDQPAQQLKDFEDVEKKDRHHIQTHFKAIPLLHDVYELQVCHMCNLSRVYVTCVIYHVYMSRV